MKDLPYPVGRTARTSLFCCTTALTSNCFGFKTISGVPRFDRENFIALSNSQFETAVILRIYFRHVLFHRLSHS